MTDPAPRLDREVIAMRVAREFQDGDVINLVDSAYALMAIPTMTSTLLLAPHVTRALREYKRKHFGQKSYTES